MDLDIVAAELYGVPLEEFTDIRNKRVKQARAAHARELADQIGSLRKPTQAAWLVNQLVRSHPDEIELLLELGRELRDVLADVSGDELRALTKQRYQLVSALVTQTRSLAQARGRRMSDDVGQAVRTTLEATLSDESCADALAAGRLTETLEVSSGFSVGSGDGGIRRKSPQLQQQSTTEPGTVTDLDAQRQRRARQRAKERVETAEASAERSRSAAEAASEQLQSAQQRMEGASAYVARLRQQLEEAVATLNQRGQEEQASREASEEAQRHEREADAELADARASLDDLSS